MTQLLDYRPTADPVPMAVGEATDEPLVDDADPLASVGKRRVLMVCSTGGHLAQLLRLRPWWEDHTRRWVTFDQPHAHEELADEDVVFGHFPTTRHVPNLVRNFGLARKVMADFKPDLVMSNGAGLAVPFFAIARATGVPTTYIEVYDRVDSRTMTGRLCRPLTDLFCVQWAQQQKLYPASVLIDPLY